MTRSPFAVRPRAAWLAGLCFMAGVVGSLSASDHADPVDPFNLQRREGRITDLFVFPSRDMVRRIRVPAEKDQKESTRPVSNKPGEANRLEIIFCVRPALTASPPFEGLDQFTYKIYADLHSANEASFQKGDLNTARYGGTVKVPEEIDADFVITVRLDNATKFVEKDVRIKEGGEWKQPPAADRIQWHSGVHDDPFIFPMFFGTNVIAMVISVPLDCFPGGQQDFLFWATSHLNGEQVDHVGRSQRTQLPRFDALNTVHPKDHVAMLRKQDQDPGLKTDVFQRFVPPPFKLRPYDFQPDVMYFTRRLDPVYPNGRQLEDDVADLTCKQGDCQLYELSFATKDPRPYAATGGRPTKNDKEFKDTFPYLAEPWPDKEPAPSPSLTAKNQTYVVLIAVAVAVVLLLPWVLYFWSKLQLWRLRAAARARAPQLPTPPAPPAPLAPPGATPAAGGPPA